MINHGKKYREILLQHGKVQEKKGSKNRFQMLVDIFEMKLWILESGTP